jgi:hypothetical protein
LLVIVNLYKQTVLVYLKLLILLENTTISPLETLFRQHLKEAHMSKIKGDKHLMNIQVNTEGLGPAQVRLVKSLNSILVHVLKAEDEDEFFDGSAEFMRLCASLIKQAKFPEQLENQGEISYADQALEFSMDILQDHIGEENIVTYDN